MVYPHSHAPSELDSLTPDNHLHPTSCPSLCSVPGEREAVVTYMSSVHKAYCVYISLSKLISKLKKPSSHDIQRMAIKQYPWVESSNSLSSPQGKASLKAFFFFLIFKFTFSFHFHYSGISTCSNNIGRGKKRKKVLCLKKLKSRLSYLAGKKK